MGGEGRGRGLLIGSVLVIRRVRCGVASEMDGLSRRRSASWHTRGRYPAGREGGGPMAHRAFCFLFGFG